jgi:hypothetical protein
VSLRFTDANRLFRIFMIIPLQMKVKQKNGKRRLGNLLRGRLRVAVDFQQIFLLLFGKIKKKPII